MLNIYKYIYAFINYLLFIIIKTYYYYMCADILLNLAKQNNKTN